MTQYLPNSPWLNIALGIVLALFVLPRIFLVWGNRKAAAK